MSAPEPATTAPPIYPPTAPTPTVGTVTATTIQPPTLPETGSDTTQAFVIAGLILLIGLTLTITKKDRK